jgi:hypothetical protein
MGSVRSKQPMPEQNILKIHRERSSATTGFEALGLLNTNPRAFNPSANRFPFRQDKCHAICSLKIEPLFMDFIRFFFFIKTSI